jgi:hypothetical protein
MLRYLQSIPIKSLNTKDFIISSEKKKLHVKQFIHENNSPINKYVLAISGSGLKSTYKLLIKNSQSLIPLREGIPDNNYVASGNSRFYVFHVP